ncbi:MAG: phosphate acyltransferase PlsX [Bacteroidota bacterium]|nr:phosphate acyltransferase PlsX [Bacteroidota bacterium]
MKVGLDVMGGDFAPEATIKGAILAHKELPSTVRIVLFGDESVILHSLQEENADPANFDIVHAPEVIGMGEHPTKALVRKPKSSISIGYKMLQKGAIDAFAGAGSSGAMMVGSIYSVGTIEGILRPCTAAILPSENGGQSIMLDVGTIVDAKPDVLYQFAILGSLYAQCVYKMENPTVGLLNIGSEEGKGNLACQAAFQQMKGSPDFNFIGNIESRDLLKGKADVIVCDGFTGNILLKNMEAMYRLIKKRGLADAYFDRFNYENFGGIPLLGINGSVVVGHGISNDVAIKNMIILAHDIHVSKLSDKIKEALSKISYSAVHDEQDF